MTRNVFFIENSDGFTLLELMIALGVFAIGILGVVAMSGGLVRHNHLAKQRTQAVALAHGKLEALRETAYADISDSLEVHLDVHGRADHGPFNRTVSVNTFNAPAYKEVRVTVSWHGFHRVALQTIRAAP
ncbi:MAG: prepilin-type N-terminal cleavage/methylation domain-containing protein [Deltaproteobacteria bacterium]|nr:prepilin-type N-terminal cleavage/methylation domain-containing protein [Deltaproteobacteria bacterium]